MTADAGRYLDEEDDTALEDAAYREIVLRHGEKVTLGQVLQTLVEIGWRPPTPRPRSRGKLPPEKLEVCESCAKTINPRAVASLCRHPTHHCPYKAFRC